MTVSILGVASCIPESLAPPSRFDEFARKWAQPSAPLDKTLAINSHTGISYRPSLHDEHSPILNRPDPPPIQDVVEVFLTKGVDLALGASKRAIADWGGSPSDITHLICTTCTGSSHPGYDQHLHQLLDLNSNVERTLIHGIGCAGGLSIVRLARNICIAAEAQGRRARILVVALEVTSTLVRTELQAIDEESQRGGSKPNVASTIFSDAASGMIVGSGALNNGEHASFEVLECVAETVVNTREDLGFLIRENGWRAILSPRVPSLTTSAVPAVFDRLTELAKLNSTPANHFDWFIHTGGSLILSSLSKALSLAGPSDDPSQTRPSWEMYKERGNSSSASIGGVIERGRQIGGRDDIIAVAFGPGVTVEMTLLKRKEWKGRSNGISNGDRVTNGNGPAHQHMEPLDVNTMGKTVELPSALPAKPQRNVKKAGECICISRSTIFGGSGLDCWCRN